MARSATRNMFADFKPGDVILSLNDQKIDSVQELQEILSQPMRSFKLIVDRHGRQMTMFYR